MSSTENHPRRRSRRVRERLGICGSRATLGLVSCVGVAASLALVLSAPVGAKTPRPVYFFSDNSQPIGPHNPLVMRPSGFALFLDGQWVLQNLRWSGWGSPVARATGISNSDTDIPNVAQGKRIKTWADMTLSYPYLWHGREVYRCFHILVPPPASDLAGCVLPDPPIGNGWLAGASGSVEFLAPGQKVWCSLDPGSSFCAGGSRTPPPALSATLTSSGRVSTCAVPQATVRTRGGCAQNWDPTPPVLALGQKVQADNVLCRSTRKGIVCAIASGRHKGAGFLISARTVHKLG